MAVLLDHNDCAPYLSVVLFKGKRVTTAKFTEDIEICLKGMVVTQQANPKGLPTGLKLSWLHIEETKEPAWFQTSGLENKLNHLIICAKYGDYLALCCTDSGLRQKVVRAIRKRAAGLATFGKLRQLKPDVIEESFVEDTVRTLWLSGVHRRTDIKADSKVLSGRELESALDPLDDQSYYFSSARTTSNNTALERNGSKAIGGVSPKQARVWLGPTQNWNDFSKRLLELLKQAGGSTGKTIPVLAGPVTDFGQLHDPYDLALIVPDSLLSEDFQQNPDDRWLQQFADQVRFKIHPITGKSDFEADEFLG